MFGKKTLGLVAGAALGVYAAPRVLAMVGVQPSEGFGMDDIGTAVIIAASVMLVDSVL